MMASVGSSLIVFNSSLMVKADIKEESKLIKKEHKRVHLSLED